jgi:GNAT superfamily N-acetyltransferase
VTADIRPGTRDDFRPALEILFGAFDDLLLRQGLAETAEVDDAELADYWPGFQALSAHLLDSGDQFWVAEKAGRPIGYARSMLRDGVRILTEFFVLPGEQEGGLGRRLIERAVPAEDDRRGLLILSTADVRAMGRYLKFGLQGQGVACRFDCPQPRHEPLPDELQPVRAEPGAELVRALAGLDRAVLGFSREADHRWWLAGRDCWVLRRDGAVSAYAYTTPGYIGPFAAPHADDLVALLVHTENLACEGGWNHGLRICLSNRPAVNHLLGRGYRMDGFWVHFLADMDLPGLDRYVVCSPPVIP